MSMRPAVLFLVLLSVVCSPGLSAAGLIDIQPRRLFIEEGQNGTVAVTRTGDLSQTCTVDYQTSGAVLPLSGTLVFGAGEALKELVVQTVDDVIANYDRAAHLSLSNPTGGWALDGSPTSTLITVRDNDLPAIHGCAQKLLTVSEGAGGVTFELTKSQNTASTTVGYVFIHGQGKLDVYPPLTATFAPGETRHFVEVRWEDDDVYSDTQQAPFFCGGQGPGVSSADTIGTIILTDDEPYPTLVAPATIEVTETDTAQQITIPISFVPQFDYRRELPVHLDHITTDNGDVKSLTTHAFDKIELEITGDDLPEPDEIVSVRLVGAVHGSITLTIADDDRPPFPYEFDRDSYELYEGSGGGSIVVQRTGSLSAAAELLLRIRPTVPGAGDIKEIPVIIDRGKSSEEVVLDLDDAFFTGTRYGILELEFSGFVGDTAHFSLTDDETIPSLSVGDGSVREGGLDQHSRLEIPVTLSGPLGVPLQVSLTPSHISTDADDFVAVPQTVTIPPGQLTATAVFEIHGDIAHEPDETFGVTAMSCCDSATVAVARPTGIATIVNDDGVPTETFYRLALGATTFNEYDQWLTIPVRRFGLVSGTTRAILKLTPADARVFAPRTVSFAPNETAREVRVFIDDFWRSGDTTVQVELLDGDRLLETATVSIIDNEETPRPFVWDNSVREGVDGTVPLRVTVSPPSVNPVTVRLRVRSGTAKTFDDYPAFDKTIELPPMTRDYEVAVPINDDRIQENKENFFVDVVGANGVVTDYATISIEDDDNPYVVSEPEVVRGTLTTITVRFPRPAPAKDAMLFLSDQRFLEGPLTVPVPAGASSVSFQVLAKTNGSISFAVEAPAFLQSVRMPRNMTIYDERRTLVLEPAALELAPGESARVVLTMSGSDWLYTMKSGDWNIAAIWGSFLNGKQAFWVHANVPGQTGIVVKIPSTGGEIVQVLPVVVKEPPVPVPPRRRAAGH